jgi:hypothetical protein
MPIPALSLFGFLDEVSAMQYLAQICLSEHMNEQYLRNQWVGAQHKLGAPISKAGSPEIQDMPEQCQDYLDGVMQNPRFPTTITKQIGGVSVQYSWSFKLVEIDPLLAFQYHVETDRADSLCAHISQRTGKSSTKAPRQIPVEALLSICLPQTVKGVEDIKPFITHQPQSILFRTRDLNFRVLAAGPVGEDSNQKLTLAGVVVGESSPLVQVMHIGDRYYLRNGFHRAYGLRKAGARYMPSLVLEGNDYNELGAVVGGAFTQTVLESDNPPTCGHFAQGRATAVKLRTPYREIHANWTEYTVLEGATLGLSLPAVWP